MNFRNVLLLATSVSERLSSAVWVPALLTRLFVG